MIIWKKIRTGEWIPWTYLLMLVFDLVYNSLVYYGGQWVGTHTKAWNIETSLDQQISRDSLVCGNLPLIFPVLHRELSGDGLL